MRTFICFVSGYEYIFDEPDDDERDELAFELAKCLDGCGIPTNENDMPINKEGKVVEDYKDLPIAFIHGKDYNNDPPFVYKRSKYYKKLVSEFEELANIEGHKRNLRNAICFDFELEGYALFSMQCYVEFIHERSSAYALGRVETKYVELNSKTVKLIFVEID